LQAITDTFWHLAGFFAPALVVGGLSALAARLFWWRVLASTRFWRLWAAASGASALASFGGLLAFQRDGKITTYAVMVLACALALRWTGFRAAGR